ncbi:hypothetical protein GXW83_26605 [Streptacidiphilus sp. PB12-B1b]|uniref:class III extradiol dioxygenase subunit B-like domain-containing protein n=1 Tax=Streptacidiphilus sp. PB12-B1b TaxID=2705012 RepID=UPI0015F8130B|nr:class III extradiol dioxygenase subunit B-like domain-containing protein [Streptacidiphilus sp. PB12-B1b]QMU78747.1 hypothetical protein GXW83_26605 [Streptacidiphilus sp. PB12-B1b]
MLVAAAVCPCPPLLVPEVASGAAPELDELRAACDAALRTVLAAGPQLIVAVGPGARHETFEQGAPGGFQPFGVDLPVRLGAGAAAGQADPGSDAAEALPPSLAVGAWLLERAGWAGAVRALAVPDYLEPRVCAENGLHLADSAERVGLLVLGEGSARRSVKAPGYLDERAEGFDARIARSLTRTDPDGGLASLDDELAFELMASGRAPWQVLAGAAGPDDAGRLKAELLYEAAPYGVGYFVAAWS